MTAGTTVIDRPDSGLGPAPLERVVSRVRLVAVCVVLTAATFLQEPGRLATDTKLDLTADPWSFLGRALHLWEPLGYQGNVQDQAYGYLFPMGPFFALGHWVGLPGWVVQRLWWSLLLCVALVGIDRLAELLGVGTRSSRLFGALAYALAPRMMSTLGPTSIEALPMAVAPWVLIPLVRGAAGGSPRRAGLRSGVAVLCVGGVNAAATAAVLPLAAIFLLTRGRGPRRNQLMAWWAVGVGAATMWWVVPLLLLGRYSPPFLSWIESARITTGQTSLVEVVRGTSDWLGFLAGTAGPQWRGGWMLVTLPAAVLDTAIIAAGGLLGLAARGMPERRLLRLGLLAGVALVCLGHVGAVGGLDAQGQRALLDGVLAPLRNVHKFDPLIRVPLALGLAHLVGVVLDRSRWPGKDGAARVLGVGLVVVGLVGAAAPLLTGTLVPRGSYAEIPPYWGQAARWLAAHTVDGRALLVPGASFGDYYWGMPKDEPLQALATTPWAVRDAVPLAPAGAIRALDAVESRLATGAISPGLAEFLARSGVQYLVVRNDLNYVTADSPRPVLVHQTLDQSGGLTRVASFGPYVGGGSTPTQEVDQQLDRPYPAVEIYAVAPPADLAVLVPDSGVGAVQAGSEGLLDALDAAAAVPAAAILAPGSGPTRLVTDTPVRREADFGRVDNHASAALSLSDPLRLNNPARDYLAPGMDSWATVAAPGGGVQVAASSSLADAGTAAGTSPQNAPFAAVDSQESTQWVAGGYAGSVGQWLSVGLAAATDLAGGTVDVATDLVGPQVNQVEVATDHGSVLRAVPADGVVALPAGRTRHLTVTAVSVAGGGFGYLFGIDEIHIPGVVASRPLAVPVDGPATGYVFTAPVGRVNGCVRVGDRPLCATGLARAGEQDGGIDRILQGSTAGTYTLSVQAVAAPSPSLAARLTQGSALTVTASSSAVADADGAPARVADGDLHSGWVASPSDHSPTLTFQFASPQTVSGVRVVLDPGLAASRPGGVLLQINGRVVEARLDRAGVARFPAERTTGVQVSFTDIQPVESYDPFTSEVTTLPVGASEVSFVGAQGLRAALPDTATVTWACGLGPTVAVDGQVVPTSGAATVHQLRRGAPIRFDACPRSVLVPAGAHLQVRSTPELVVRSVALLPLGSAAAGVAVPGSADAVVGLRRLSWAATDRSVAVPARSTGGLIVVRENANPGWVATLNGQRLLPVVVDGWQQAWRLPAGGAGVVRLVFAPDSIYRWGLLVGAVVAVGLVFFAFVRRPRAHPRVHPAAVGAAEWSAVRRVDVVVVGFAAVTLAVVAAWALPVLAVAVGAAVVMPVSAGRVVRVSVIAGAGCAAFGALVLHPWASGGSYAGGWGWVQLAVASALAAVATAPPSAAPDASAG